MTEIPENAPGAVICSLALEYFAAHVVDVSTTVLTNAANDNDAHRCKRLKMK